MQTETTVVTQTGSITKTKMVVATLVAVAAGAANFIVSPPINYNIAPPVISAPLNGAVVPLPAGITMRYAWGAVPNATNYRFNLDYLSTANNTTTWQTIFDYFRGNYTSNYTMMGYGPGQYRVRVQAILGATSSPFSAYNYFTYSVLQMPDLLFGPNPQVPTFASGTLSIPWGNGGNTTTRFIAGQTIYTVTALDSNGVVVKGVITMNNQPTGNPMITTAGNDGSGGMSYAVNSFGKAILNNLVLPSSTAKLLIILDPNKVIAEYNERNNTYTIILPLPAVVQDKFSCAKTDQVVPGNFSPNWSLAGTTTARNNLNNTNEYKSDFCPNQNQQTEYYCNVNTGMASATVYCYAGQFCVNGVCK